jgi:hypothetical protein
MPAHRLLFASSRPTASLTSICAALLALVAIALIGLAVIFWRAGSESPRESAGREEPPASASPAIAETWRAPREVRDPRKQMKSM